MGNLHLNNHHITYVILCSAWYYIYIYSSTMMADYQQTTKTCYCLMVFVSRNLHCVNEEEILITHTHIHTEL